ncbi:MAG: hypothetical protein CFK52_00090 [Chloracidobacterium sp. CP2_5A]|nr:MAG: hypothetical protein CFK52_00090 [Chloracidobacterium sp. CP2_5A]
MTPAISAAAPAANSALRVARATPLDTALDAAHSLVLSLWLGAMVFFSAAVAPSAFGVLPTRALAGALVNSVLGKLEWWGLTCGLLLIGLQWLQLLRAGRLASWKGGLLLALPAMMTLNVALSKLVVSARLSALRAGLGGEIEKLPLDDPIRLTFAAWHQYSVWLMAFNILAAAALVILCRVWLRPAASSAMRESL